MLVWQIAKTHAIYKKHLYKQHQTETGKKPSKS